MVGKGSFLSQAKSTMGLHGDSRRVLLWSFLFLPMVHWPELVTAALPPCKRSATSVFCVHFTNEELRPREVK